MRRWCVVQTQIRAEDRANFHLRNQTFKVFYPRYRKQRRHARRIESVLRPLFPGYLFVELDVMEQSWNSINGTVGVIKLVTSNFKPLSVPIGVVENIILQTDCNGVVQSSPFSFTSGQRVRMLSGAFADCEALFDEMDDNNRAVLLLNLMGRQVRTQVPVETLDAIY